MPSRGKPKTEKEILWSREAAAVEEITDGLGKKVDENIKEAVIAFHLCGFQTYGSCEGHTGGEHGLPYPWVDITIPEPEGWKENETIQKEWRIKNLMQQKRMLALLEKFYSTRETPMDMRLIFNYVGIYGGFRLQSFGAKLMDLLTPEEIKEKYPMYKKEMDDFSEFLKEAYFGKK